MTHAEMLALRLQELLAEAAALGFVITVSSHDGLLVGEVSPAPLLPSDHEPQHSDLRH